MTSGLIILAVFLLFGSLTQYSSTKGAAYEGNKNRFGSMRRGEQRRGPPAIATGVSAANPAGQNERPSRISGGSISAQGLPPSCSAGPRVEAGELLPRNGSNSWAQLNPTGQGNMENINLLKAGYHSGINTVGNTLRNANLQLRSEPPNPTSKVSPWMNTTIAPDLMRTPLEIGCGPQ